MFPWPAFGAIWLLLLLLLLLLRIQEGDGDDTGNDDALQLSCGDSARADARDPRCRQRSIRAQPLEHHLQRQPHLQGTIDVTQSRTARDRSQSQLHLRELQGAGTLCGSAAPRHLCPFTTVTRSDMV